MSAHDLVEWDGRHLGTVSRLRAGKVSSVYVTNCGRCRWKSTRCARRYDALDYLREHFKAEHAERAAS